MKGTYNSATDIRKNVFTEIARPAYEDGGYASSIERLPFKVIPGERATYRDSIFLGRAIVSERLRLGIGLLVRRMGEHSSLSDGIEESTIVEKYYNNPLVDVVRFTCNACSEETVVVTDACQGCLAHPCKEVCPKDAISMMNGKSYIDQEKYIKCGHCMDVCPCDAVSKLERPYTRNCGMGVITSDKLGRAEIDYDKCISCGMCLVNCPFGAIVDKGQIFQTIHTIKSDKEVIAAVAPAFAGQFESIVAPEKVKGALKELGFADVVEVAVGADLCIVEKVEDFLGKVPAEQPFMAAPYCPAWSIMARKLFPDFKPYISMALTPMVLTGWLIKKQKPDTKVIFIGSCAAKKLEVSRKSAKSDMDFVLTSEEVMGMLEARGINLPQVGADAPFGEGAVSGRGFTVSGGIANAVEQCIQKEHPGKEVLIDSAGGLKNCRTMLMIAKAGERSDYLLEGMVYPDGCVAGARTLQPMIRFNALAKKYTNDTEKGLASENEYLGNLDLLTKE